jgi:hypothetical protein
VSAADRRHGLNFLVHVRGVKSFDVVAEQVASALGVPFSPAEPIGVRDAFYADFAGLRVWLQLQEPAPDVGRVVSLMGVPEPSLDPDVEWVDLSAYIAELLTAGTPHQWTAPTD